MTSGPLLIVAARGQVVAFRRDNGTEVWRFVYQTQFLGMQAGFDGSIDGHMLWQTPHGLMKLVSGAALGVPGNVRQGDESGSS